MLLHPTAEATMTDPARDGIVTVEGFPAVRSTPSGADPAHNCILYVDVAADHSLAVDYTQTGPGATRESVCAEAHQAASLMVSTLAARPSPG